ncbi:MAG: hypothetical protein LBL83_01825 [Clostridiales bacterium]|jgi:hypothetical protein|nr:hypothetical protein [Clostridiales bacterium]
MPANFDDFKIAVESLSGGKNTVLLDDIGMPSVMFIQPKLLSSDIITGATQTTHPAFILNSAELDKVAISKYINIVANGRAYSLPGQDPRGSIAWDASSAVCRAKGGGWGLIPFALWSAIALWSRKNGTMPRGNNNYGADHAYPHEKGVPSTELDSSGRAQKTATGSGPATWNHNWQVDGIADMNGNAWEWNSGVRLCTGEIQIIPYANSMDNACDMSLESSQWKAILPDGSLVSPDTAGTLKFDYVNNSWQISGETASLINASRTGSITAITAKNGVAVPQILKDLALYPAEPGGDYGNDYIWINNTMGESMGRRGGYWADSSQPGVFASSFSYERSRTTAYLGFRSAYYGPL